MLVSVDARRTLGDVALIGTLALGVRLAIILAGPALEAGDMAGWEETTRRVTLVGVHAGYASLDPGSLYPPAFLYPLWIIGQAYRLCCSPEVATGTRTLDALLRAGPSLADALLAALVYALARTWSAPGPARWAGLVYAVCPAVLVTVAQQGMIGDPALGVLVVLALLGALHGRPLLATVCLVLAVLTKPQAVALVPLGVLVLLGRTTARQRPALLAAAALTVLAVLLPFVLHGTLGDVWAAFGAMAGLHAFTQNSADNLWTLLPVWRLPDASVGPFGAVPDDTLLLPGVTCRDAGLLALVGLQAIVLARLGRLPGPRAVAEAGAVLVVGSFFVATRMHVNYIFLAFPFLCALAPSGSLRLRLALVAITVACLTNWQDDIPWAVHRANAALYATSLLVLGLGRLGRSALPVSLGRLPRLARPRLAWRRIDTSGAGR